MAGGDLNFNDREVVLRADLSTVDDLDCVWTPMRFLMHGPRSPQPGERVLLVDISGTGTCLGRVVSVTGWEACIRPDWETWSGTAMPSRGRGHMLPPQSFGRGPGAST
ncbi:MAG: hypothetical protein ACRDLQ_09250 [Solirubrobacterales bacterium]